MVPAEDCEPPEIVPKEELRPDDSGCFDPARCDGLDRLPRIRPRKKSRDIHSRPFASWTVMFPNRFRQAGDAKADGVRFAFRVESDRVILAIGEAADDQTVAVRFDCVRLEDSELASSITPGLVDATDAQTGLDAE